MLGFISKYHFLSSIVGPLRYLENFLSICSIPSKYKLILSQQRWYLNVIKELLIKSMLCFTHIARRDLLSSGISFLRLSLPVRPDIARVCIPFLLRLIINFSYLAATSDTFSPLARLLPPPCTMTVDGMWGVYLSLTSICSSIS